MYEVSAHIGQSALKDLNVAFERFCKSVKNEGPKAGYPRFKKKRAVSVGSRWFVSLAVEREREIVLPEEPRRASEVVGVDLGLTNAAVIHDGAQTRVVEPQRALRRNIAKLRRRRTGRRRSYGAPGSITGFPASGRRCCTSCRASSREPSG